MRELLTRWGCVIIFLKGYRRRGGDQAGYPGSNCAHVKYSTRAEQAYVDWIKRFILFHGKRHPDAMGKAEVRAVLAQMDDPVPVHLQQRALHPIADRGDSAASPVWIVAPTHFIPNAPVGLARLAGAIAHADLVFARQTGVN